MRIRENTWDAQIVTSVLIRNEYGLPNDMRGAVVLDIGAHIGAFTVACQKRNAKLVHCYEPDPENFELLAHNVNEDPESRTQVVIIDAAVMGQTRHGGIGIRRLTEHDFDGGRNTGHVDIFGESDDTRAVGINEAISAVGQPIDLMKVDCEGSEWEIFDCISDDSLTKIRAISVELHDMTQSEHPALETVRSIAFRESAEKVVRNLQKHGFEINIIYDSPVTAKLQASRTAVAKVKDSLKPLRLLWLGDCGVYTGFGKVTENICGRLVNLGWDVHVLGIGYSGDPHRFPFKVYPAVNSNTGGNPWGLTRLAEMIRGLRPDIAVLQHDNWNIGLMTDHMAMTNIWVPAIGYAAVDSGNVRQDVAIQLRNLKHVICHTNFGVEHLVKAGYTGRTSVAGHGVDRKLYTTYDKEESREGIAGLIKKCSIKDAFIFGVVAANQPRKRLDLSMYYFSEWWKRNGKPENAFLYIHTNADGAWDLRQLADYCGVRGRYLATDGGPQLPDNCMPSLYNAFDVLISTSECESFGLPHLEAAACGIPQIAMDFGGLPSWAGKAVYWVKTGTPHFLENKINAHRYAPDEADFVRAMQHMYSSEILRQDYKKRGLETAAKPEFDWSNVALHFDTVMRQVLMAQTQARQSEIDCLTEFV